MSITRQTAPEHVSVAESRMKALQPVQLGLTATGESLATARPELACGSCRGSGSRYISCNGHGMIALPCDACGAHDVSYHRILAISCWTISAIILVIAGWLIG